LEVKLTNHLHTVPKLGMGGSITSLPHTPPWRGQRQAVHVLMTFETIYITCYYFILEELFYAICGEFLISIIMIVEKKILIISAS